MLWEFVSKAVIYCSVGFYTVGSLAYPEIFCNRHGAHKKNIACWVRTLEMLHFLLRCWQVANCRFDVGHLILEQCKRPFHENRSCIHSIQSRSNRFSKLEKCPNFFEWWMPMDRIESWRLSVKLPGLGERLDMKFCGSRRAHFRMPGESSEWFLHGQHADRPQSHAEFLVGLDDALHVFLVFNVPKTTLANLLNSERLDALPKRQVREITLQIVLAMAGESSSLRVDNSFNLLSSSS